MTFWAGSCAVTGTDSRRRVMGCVEPQPSAAEADVSAGLQK